MKIESALISGAGNTFHIITETAEWKFPIDAGQRKALAKDICLKKPADGFIFLKKKSGQNLEWYFYNNDGSDAEMCGNATRCVGYYAKSILKDEGNEWRLQTVAGEIQIKLRDQNLFEVIMTAIVELRSAHGFYCNTGVPHLIIEIDEFANFEKLKSAAQKLRNDPEFFPSGTNVTYIEKSKIANYLKAVSYERGVEDFTEACGTGAMAAAFYNLKKHAVVETNVEMPGGMLIMNLSDLKKPVMIGPAVLLERNKYEI